jgi:predicted nucleic-acid-binding protein
MGAVTTNVLVRLFADDDAGQSATARQTLATDAILMPKTVMVEFEWVLRCVYGLPKAAILTALEAIMATSNVELEDAASVARAVDWFRQGLDFADALHLASSGHADDFLTFDVRMRRRVAAMDARPSVTTP